MRLPQYPVITPNPQGYTKEPWPSLGLFLSILRAYPEGRGNGKKQGPLRLRSGLTLVKAVYMHAFFPLRTRRSGHSSLFTAMKKAAWENGVKWSQTETLVALHSSIAFANVIAYFVLHLSRYSRPPCDARPIIWKKIHQVSDIPRWKALTLLFLTVCGMKYFID